MTLHDDATPNPQGYRDVSPTRVDAARGRVRIVDVRESAELIAELGHIPGVEHVPLGAIDALAAGWDRDQELVLVCRSGARSGRAAASLARAGFRRVMNMTGGMMAWNAERRAVDRAAPQGRR